MTSSVSIDGLPPGTVLRIRTPYDFEGIAVIDAGCSTVLPGSVCYLGTRLGRRQYEGISLPPEVFSFEVIDRAEADRLLAAWARERPIVERLIGDAFAAARAGTRRASR